ncbi:MAG: DMT family transporter [Clostridium sp.]|jgi:drug/metabolite transporter (DMT)-like permease|nr:DMT family transporter [Clostridium sp.]
MILFVTAIIWGMAFVSQSKGMEYMEPLTFNGVRSLIGAAVLLNFLGLTKRRKNDKTKNRKSKEYDNPQSSEYQNRQSNQGLIQQSEKYNNSKSGQLVGGSYWKTAVLGGVFCGIALTIASTLQQFGIQYTTVGKSGFITTLYILFVPFLGLFLKRKVRRIVWLAAVIAITGMYLLCMTSSSFAINPGDFLTFLCAIAFAVHILIIDHYTTKVDGCLLSMIQFSVCGLICTTGALLFENPSFDVLIAGIWPLLYAGVLCCAVAYTLQIIGQKGLNPTIAALVMSLESVVAALAGYGAYQIGILQTDQTLTARQIWGCVMVFAAVTLVQLPERKKEKSHAANYDRRG